MRYIFFAFIFVVLSTGCQNSQSTSASLGNVTNGSSVTAGRTQIIQATAQDPNGISRVDFYANNALIPTCSITSAPYNCNWSVPAGAGVAYQLQTKAYDAQGKVGVSPIVNVTSR
jgi:hypothetical protein